MQINRMKFTKMEMRMGPFMIHHSEELMMVSQHPKSSKWILTIVHIMMNTLGTPVRGKGERKRRKWEQRAHGEGLEKEPKRGEEKEG